MITSLLSLLAKIFILSLRGECAAFDVVIALSLNFTNLAIATSLCSYRIIRGAGGVMSDRHLSGSLRSHGALPKILLAMTGRI